MPRLSAEEMAKRAAAREALQAPTIPPARPALVDAAAHEQKLREAEALRTDTAPIDASELPKGWVLARILRKGHDKVFTGQIDGTQHDAEAKFTRYKFGDIIPLPADVAIAQENNGHLEIEAPFRAELGLPVEA